MTEEKPIGRPRRNPILVDETGNEYVEVVARQQGNTGAALIPKDWIGCQVRVVKLK